MTDKQKSAIWALNEAMRNKAFDEEEYLLILEFIMGNQPTTQYIPWPIETPAYPLPLVTYKTICNQ